MSFKFYQQKQPKNSFSRKPPDVDAHTFRLRDDFVVHAHHQRVEIVGRPTKYGFHLSFVDDSFLARIGVDVAGDKAGFQLFGNGRL